MKNDGENPVILGPGTCRQTPGNFPLHHQRRVNKPLALIQNPEQYFARDVVRDVSDDAQPEILWNAEIPQAHGQDVAVDERSGRETGSQE